MPAVLKILLLYTSCYYASLSPETQSQQRLEWAQELADLDTEISQLEVTLRSKVRSGELNNI